MFESLYALSINPVLFWLIVVLGLAMGLDVRTRKIPNNLVFIGLFILLALEFYTYSLQPFSTLIGLAVGLILWQLNLVGGGDSKLLILVSAAFALDQLLMVYLCISLCGAAQALWYQHVKKQTNLPYAVAIFVGTAIFLSTSTLY